MLEVLLLYNPRTSEPLLCFFFFSSPTTHFSLNYFIFLFQNPPEPKVSPPPDTTPQFKNISCLSEHTPLSLRFPLNLLWKKNSRPPSKKRLFFSSLSYLSPCYNPQKCLSCHVAPFSVQFCLLSSNGCVSPFWNNSPSAAFLPTFHPV